MQMYMLKIFYNEMGAEVRKLMYGVLPRNCQYGSG